jgi:hypothetical protein
MDTRNSHKHRTELRGSGQRPYREREHDILTVDTAALLSSHVEEVTSLR